MRAGRLIGRSLARFEMKILLTGACGFVGNVIVGELLAHQSGIELVGIDNFIRPGSESNREELRRRGAKLFHTDIRAASDIELLPKVDWVIDAAANASVLAGVDGATSSRQLVEHNLIGTTNLLEYCRRHGAGFVLLSTSRVYSIEPLAALPIVSDGKRFNLANDVALPAGVSASGISEQFSVAARVSIYGATKLASEILALEYGYAFDFPVWINRCGLLAGAGQFGRPDQGILAYWINAYLRRIPLRYTGFDGTGHQVRDAFHPRDLAKLIGRQLEMTQTATIPRTVNFGGGAENSFSLAELSDWCANRFGFQDTIERDPHPRPFDLPWIVIDSDLARRTWKWQPAVSLPEIMEEIAVHAEQHPDWLSLSGPF